MLKLVELLSYLLSFIALVHSQGPKSILADLSFNQCSYEKLCVTKNQEHCMYDYINQMIPLEVPYVVINQYAISSTCTLLIENINYIITEGVAVQYYFIPNKDYGRLGAVAMRYGMDVKAIEFNTEFTWIHFNFSGTNKKDKYEHVNWPDFEILSWWWGGPGEHPSLIVIQNITVK